MACKSKIVWGIYNYEVEEIVTTMFWTNKKECEKEVFGKDEIPVKIKMTVVNKYNKITRSKL